MSWWCAASTKPWTWSPQIYVGIWLLMGATLLAYFGGASKARSAGWFTTSRKQKTLFTVGILVLWGASDWPLGTLGAGYLASAHMAQFILYTMAAIPLILLGVPAEMFRRTLAGLRLTSATRFLSKPLVAAATFNIIMVTTHSPPVTDFLRGSQTGSFAMDLLWIVGAVALWLPLISPIESHRLSSYPGKMVYLFVTVGIVVIVPSAALIITEEPMYLTYELAPSVLSSWSALEDQQFAGVIMKLGATPIVWGAILAMFIRWTNESGLSNKFGPKYHGRLVHADGTVDAESDQRTAQDIASARRKPDVPAMAGLQPEQLN